MNYLDTINLNSNFLLSSIYSFYKSKRIIINGVLHFNNIGVKKHDRSARKFYVNLHGFLDFLSVFSEVFYNHYYHLSSLIIEFKNKNPGPKEVYAELISDKYKNYISEISKIRSPAFIKPLLKVYLSALEKNNMYYCLYNDFTSNDEIRSLIEKNATLLEKRFWRRLNKVNDYFKHRIANY